MKRNLSKLISIFLIILSLGMVFGFAEPANNKIQANIFINKVDVSGMTKEQALKALKNSFDPTINGASVQLVYGANTWKLGYKTIAVSYNYTKAIEEALSIVRDTPTTSDSSITPVTTASSITTSSPIVPPVAPITRKDIALTMTYNSNSITNFLSTISKKINTSPVNAVMKTTGRTFVITDGKNGTSLDVNNSLNKIVKSITSLSKTKVVLVTKVVIPQYTKSNFLNIKDKLGEFTTYFNNSTVSRVTNIKVAAGNVNNYIIMPNEIFSVNKTVGPRLEETGFKLAHVIVNNRFVDGIGGGICQVSTTLYNAVLLANLKIIERNHHSIPSTYVKVGRDATISGDAKDLKFQNTTKYPIYLTNEVKNGQITFRIYGKNDYPNRKVVIKTQILSETRPTTHYVNDPTLPKGKVVVDVYPAPAYTVQSTREIYENGKLISTEDLYLDKYPLINGIKKIGTKTN